MCIKPCRAAGKMKKAPASEDNRRKEALVFYGILQEETSQRILIKTIDIFAADVAVRAVIQIDPVHVV